MFKPNNNFDLFNMKKTVHTYFSDKSKQVCST